MEQVYFHVDMDAFFASVESLDHSEYRGLPLIVGGIGPRGVVSSCSYEARTFGVHSAMPMFKARQLCPDGIFVRGRMERYSQMSRTIIGILQTFSPCVQQISIDEAFLDMSGTQRLFGSPKEAARKLKDAVRSQTGLVISVGIGPSRYIAKMASSYGKPDGLCRVAPGKEILFIDTLGLNKLWGIGDSSLKVLHQHRIETPEQIRNMSLDYLIRTFGDAAGHFFHSVAYGKDPGIYTGEVKSRSISTETTFPVDLSDIRIIRQQLLRMSHEVMFRSLEEHVIGTTVAIKLRYGDFTTVSAQESRDTPYYSAEEIFAASSRLIESKWNKLQSIRLLGVGLHNVVTQDKPQQQELFDDGFKRKRELEKTVLALRNKGRVIEKATNLMNLNQDFEQ